MMNLINTEGVNNMLSNLIKVRSLQDFVGDRSGSSTQKPDKGR